jgi:serine/threonine protein kinase/uncharacterized protein (UPF0333 family)
LTSHDYNPGNRDNHGDPDGSDTPAYPLAADSVLQNRYRIVRQLGRGGMGAVYEAVDSRLGITVALKETLSSEDSMRKQFEREARLLAGMQHPALPRVSDHFVEGNRAFLVMQFIGGVDLARIISQQPGPFPREQVIAWADQLLDALIYLHSRDRQVIHRDIKPHNLKLTATGQIALLDFGLAKAQPSDPSITSSQAFFGYTRHYAPLEQIQDQRTDPRSDIYALGATLYHLLTGIKPPDAMVRAAAVVNAGPDPLLAADKIHAAVGPQIAAILNKAMAQKPEDRYENAEEFREALRRMGRTKDVAVIDRTNQPRINADARRSELRVGVRSRIDERLGSVPPARQKETAFAQKPAARPSGLLLYSSDASDDYAGDSSHDEPVVTMALVASARRFGPAGVTAVLALIVVLAGGLMYGAQRWFPSAVEDAAASAVTPNAAALRSSASARKQDRTRVADSTAMSNAKAASTSNNIAERALDNASVSAVTKAQTEKRSVNEPVKFQTEKRTVVVAKPSGGGAGQESLRNSPRSEPRRVGAPSIRFPSLEFHDNGPAPSTRLPDSRMRAEGSTSAAPKVVPAVGSPRFFRAADGTQIVKFPDGSTQFIRPGQRTGAAGGSYR